MGLSFLAPLFLAGLAALAIPVIIHLRRRHEKKRVDFPSLMFLRDVPFKSERRRNIRHPFLLLLRAAALALLAAAFARPFLHANDSAAAGVVGPRELVLLVDRSWSMEYRNRWNEAREAARRAAASLGPSDRVSLVLFDEGADAPLRSSPDRDRVARLLDEAQPGDRATRLAPALRLARSILETSRLPRKEVVLISDFQASSWTGDQDARLPAGVTFTPVPVGADEPAWSNATVASVELRRSGTGDRDAVVPTARILRRGGEGEPDSVTAILEVDGRERERTRTDLTGGSARVQFGPVALAGRPLPATVRIEGDSLAPDDEFHLVLTPGRRISVLVLQPSRARPNASLFLRRALELSTDPPMQVQVASGPVPKDVGDDFDVVVLNDRGSGNDEAAVAAFLKAGGGVLWAPGDAAGLSEGPLDRIVGAPGEIRDPREGEELRLGSVDRSHPVFAPFRKSGTGNFGAARFFRTRRIVPADSSRIVARFDDGSPALVESTAGGGRAMEWASTLHTYWTDLPVQPVWVPLIQRAIVYLANRKEAIPAYQVGGILSPPETSREGAESDESETWSGVTAPDGDHSRLTGEEGPIVLTEAGFYQLEKEGEEGTTPVAVNVDPREGDLTRRDVDEIRAAVAPVPAGESGKAGAAGSSLSPEVRREDQERHQGLWRFLLVAAFAFLVGETALSNRLSRKRAES